MTTSPMTNPGLADLAIRAPAPVELERVLHLFRNLSLCAEAWLLVAVRTRPVERFVGAIACWSQGTVGRFQLACQPGANRAAVAGALIEAVTDGARRAGMASVQYADLLSAEHEWTEVLRAHGFARLRSERSFEVAYRAAWTRVMRLHQKHRADIPAGWRTDPIRLHPPELILDVIAPHRLLTPAEVRRFWQDQTPGGFDLENSCILFEGPRPFGVFLLRRPGEIAYIDVQVVQEPNPLRRSLGDLCLLYHGVQQLGPEGPLRWLRFRSGEIEHRQTANLALRMGGRELPPRHVLAKKL